jgi:hypothetical protein
MRKNKLLVAGDIPSIYQAMDSIKKELGIEEQRVIEICDEEVTNDHDAEVTTAPMEVTTDSGEVTMVDPVDVTKDVTASLPLPDTFFAPSWYNSTHNVSTLLKPEKDTEPSFRSSTP